MMSNDVFNFFIIALIIFFFTIIIIILIRDKFRKIEPENLVNIKYLTPEITKITIYVHRHDANSSHIYNKIARIFNSVPCNSIPHVIELKEVSSKIIFRCERCNVSFLLNLNMCKFCGSKLDKLEFDDIDNIIPIIKTKDGKEVRADIDSVPLVLIDDQLFFDNGVFDEKKFIDIIIILEKFKEKKRLEIMKKRTLLYRFSDFIKMPQNIRFPRPYTFSLFTKSNVDLSKNPIEVNNDGIMYNPLLDNILRELGFVVIRPNDLGIILKEFNKMERIRKIKEKHVYYDLGDVLRLEELSRQYLKMGGKNENS